MSEAEGDLQQVAQDDGAAPERRNQMSSDEYALMSAAAANARRPTQRPQPVRAPPPPPAQSASKPSSIPSSTKMAEPTPAPAPAPAKEEDFSEVRKFEILSTAGVDKLSRPVFVFCADNMPPKEDLDHDLLLRYMTHEMDAIVENDYSIVYFHHGLNSRNKPSLSWLRKVYSNFDRKYKKNLKALYIVHATMFVRTVLGLLKPFISAKFGRKLTHIHYLSELEEFVHVDQLNIPPVVKAYDAEQVAKREKSKKAPAPSAAPARGSVFNVPLPQVKPLDPNGIPQILITCIDYIRNNGMEMEGIFRRSANTLTVKEVKTNLDAGQNVDFDEYGDVFLAAVLVKNFLRDLPEPILTFALYDDVLRHTSVEGEAKLVYVKELLGRLPEVNRRILKLLFEFLRDLDAKNEVNKMTASNLAIVIGPNLLWSREMAANLSAMGHINSFTQYLIVNCDSCFGQETA